MFDRNQRHIDADRRRKRARPLPGAADHDLAFDPAMLGHDATNAPVLDIDRKNRRVLEDLDARHARTLGECLRHVGGIGLAVGRQERRPHHIVDLHQRPEILRLLRAQQMHFETEGMCGCRLPLDLGPAFGVAGKPQAPVHLPARAEAGFLFECVVECDRVTEQLRNVGAGPQLADKTGRMKGCAGGQLLAFEQNRIGPAQLSQVIGCRAADDSAADDDRFGRAG